MTRTYAKAIASVAVSDAFQRLLDELRQERHQREIPCPDCVGSGLGAQWDVDDFGSCVRCNGDGVILKEVATP